jgi:hypothetical protein
MRKILYVVPAVALLSACVPSSDPCMDIAEKGTVVRAESDIQEYCGRGGCSQVSYTYITIKVNGVSRTCIVSDSTAKMFLPGEVINLQTGRRL